MKCLLVLVLATVASRLDVAVGANVLFIPYTDGSHILQMAGVGNQLMDRGHQVFMLLQVGFKMPPNSDSRFHVLHYGTPKSEKDVAQLKEHNNAGGSTSLTMQKIVDAVCMDMITDPDLWTRLEGLQLDLVVVDNFDTACFYLVPFKLGKQFATLSSTVPVWHNRLPVLPSVTKYMLGLDKWGPSFCIEPDSLPRLVRAFCLIRLHYSNEITSTYYETDMHAYLDYPPMEILRSNASLALINNSPLLGTLYPQMPNVQFIGGVTTRPGGKLSDELQKWMDEADNVVVVSFGSRFTRLANNGNEKLLAAFSKLNYRFLVRFKVSEYINEKVPANVKIVDWLPQNDVLAHRHTRLMIAHCGLNGLFEALYHAVPMICLYVDADQPANGRKIQKLGYGFSKRSTEFETEWVVEKVNEMMKNDSYRHRIRRASEIFASEKHPAERAADALEHLIEFGGEHLRSTEAYALKWWQYYMLDVVAVVYTFILLIAIVAYKLLRKVMCLLFCKK